MAKAKKSKRLELTLGPKLDPKLDPKQMNMPMHPALIPHFGYCFAKSALKLRKHLSDEMEKVGIQLPHMGLMIILAKAGPMNQISLGEEMAIDKATMVKVLDSMEHSGLVKRKTDTKDRRVKLVELTPKGRGLIPKMHKMREDVEDRFLSSLTKAEVVELRRLVQKLVNNVES